MGLPISYCNASGEDVPPFSFIQFDGALVPAADGATAIFNAVKPGAGVGPIFVDTGAGALNSRSGLCCRVATDPVWINWTGMSPPALYWGPIGPQPDDWGASESGGGFIYAGGYNVANSTVLAFREITGKVHWSLTTSAITAATLSGSGTSQTLTPTQFTAQLLVKNGSTWPYPQKVTTDTQLRTINCVNRLPNLTRSNTPTMQAIVWDDELLEWTSVIIDC